MTDSPRLTAADGRVSLAGLAGVWARAVLSDGSAFSTLGGEAVMDGEAVTVTTAGAEAKPALRWTARPEGEGWLVTLEVENTLPYPLSIERLDVLVAPDGLASAPAASLAIAQTGWQSWSFASPEAPWSAHAPFGTTPKLAPDTGGGEAERLVSPWATRVTTGDHALLLGFVEANHFHGTLAVQPTPEAHRLTASCQTEGRRVAPGERLASEPLWVSAELSAEAAWARYAGMLGDRMNARRPQDVTVGWCSWYHFFTDVTEADMRRNLATLAGTKNRLPVGVVQLDDGYQTAVGDWLSINEKFPSGLKSLVDAIHAEGFEAGLWLAPFMVSEDSAVYRAHPEWVLRDASGEPLNAITNWGARNFGLDTTHPGVEAYLRDVFGTIVDAWGFDYLKIDFVYAGAMRAKRHDPGVTSLEAYRRGLEIIREVVGDRFVLGCGAPLASSVGLVDGMRVGPDTAPHWGNPDPHGAEPALINAVRSTLARGWMHRAWFVNDPDCVIVRRDRSELTPAEVQTWLATVALSGGMVLFSDDMSVLEHDRWTLLPRLLPPSGEAAAPHGPVTNGLSAAMHLGVDRPWEHWEVVALFNWTDDARASMFDPAAWGVAEPYHLFDLFKGEHLGPLSGPTLLAPTEPHGVRLLSVHADLGRPQLVGTTFHLLGEAVEVASETWENDALTLTLTGGCDRRGELYLYVPDGWDVADAPAGAIAHGRVIELPFVYRGLETVRLTFTREAAPAAVNQATDVKTTRQFS